MTLRIPFLRRFAKSEDGSGTIEFAIFLPFMMMLFMTTFELGMTMTRQVMLDRGTDMAVRMVRLGRITPVTHDALKASICNMAAIIPNCMQELKLEMQPIDPRAYTMLPVDTDCIDRGDPAAPVRTFVPGNINQLMILRVCALFDPYIPTSALGAAIPKESGGAYALVSTSAFVIEPDDGGV
jgi:hypothetical protein